MSFNREGCGSVGEQIVLQREVGSSAAVSMLKELFPPCRDKRPLNKHVTQNTARTQRHWNPTPSFRGGPTTNLRTLPHSCPGKVTRVVPHDRQQAGKSDNASTKTLNQPRFANITTVLLHGNSGNAERARRHSGLITDSLR